MDVDTQLLQQMFTTLTGTSRDIQSLQQAFRALEVDVQALQGDMSIARNFIATASRKSLVLRREIRTLMDG